MMGKVIIRNETNLIKITKYDYYDAVNMLMLLSVYPRRHSSNMTNVLKTEKLIRPDQGVLPHTFHVMRVDTVRKMNKTS